MKGNPIVRICGVAKSYGPVQAVGQLDLEVGAGEIVCLVGPSGCGKTTTIRIVAGLETADSGTVCFEGDSPRLGLVFQQGALFPHMTVAENVAFGLNRLHRARRDEKVTEALALVGLENLELRMPYELSGGEQQRVALARALAPEPALLLLDEPLSHLERQLRAHLADEMVAIVRSSGAGALWVTHDQEEGLSVADRVAVMEAGRLRQVDAPEHLWRNPADASVAGFIGAGEILSATVRDGRAATVLGPVAAPGHAEGCEVKVLVRPEDVSIGGEGTAAEVIRRGFIGGDTVYYLRLQDGGHVRSRERGGVKYESGAQVRVQLNGSSLTVFSE